MILELLCLLFCSSAPAAWQSGVCGGGGDVTFSRPLLGSLQPISLVTQCPWSQARTSCALEGPASLSLVSCPAAPQPQALWAAGSMLSGLVLPMLLLPQGPCTCSPRHPGILPVIPGLVDGTLLTALRQCGCCGHPGCLGDSHQPVTYPQGPTADAGNGGILETWQQRFPPGSLFQQARPGSSLSAAPRHG